jgi:aryl-alcohol dehydrogenase-like predicted oxidoreductase
MKLRLLGRHGPMVSAIGLGCMGMSPTVYGASVQDTDSIRTIHRALDIGMTFLDTAELYGRGHNEELIGKAIKERRAEVFLATKFGVNRPPGSGWSMSVDGRPETVRRAVEGSLKRLGVEHIDLYYQHRIDREIPIEETVGAMAELVRQGKIRYIGLSEASAESIRRAHAVHPVAAVQSEYSLWSRDIEQNGVADTLQELGIALVPYSPLGRGFFSGQLRTVADLPEHDFRRTLPRFSEQNFAKNLGLLTRVEAIAERKHIPPAQVALAWVLARGPMTIPIPGTTKIARLEQNAAAAEIDLSESDIGSLEGFAREVTGPRYADMSWVNR